MEPDAFPALATKPSGSPRAVPEHGCSCTRGNLASRFLLWTSQISRQSWVRLIPGSVAALVTTAGAAEGAAVGRKQQGWDRGVICEPQGKVGPGGGREEKAELERRDSEGKKGKNKIKIKIKNKQTRGSYWQRRDPCTGRVRGAGAAQSWGRGDRVRANVSDQGVPQAALPSVLPGTHRAHGEHQVPQAPTQGSPGASLPQGLHGDQARWRLRPWDRGLLCFPKALCSLGQTWGTGNPRDHLPRDGEIPVVHQCCVDRVGCDREEGQQLFLQPLQRSL